MDPSDARKNGPDDGLTSKRKRDDDDTDRSDNETKNGVFRQGFKAKDDNETLLPASAENMDVESGDERIIDQEEKPRCRDAGLENNNSESEEEEDYDSDGEEYSNPVNYGFAQTCLRIARNDSTLVAATCSLMREQYLNDAEFFWLGNALMGNTHLRSLHIDHTSPNMSNTHLRSLHIDHTSPNLTTNGGIRALRQGITQSQLHTLSIMDVKSEPVLMNLFKNIGKASTLRELTITCSRLKTLHLTKLHNLLTCLTLVDCRLNDSDMMAWSKWLSGRSNLLSLNLSENDITDIGVNCICEHWKADSPLQELTLKSNKIGSNGALLLIRETTRHFAFCKLDISGNRTIGHRGLELIGQELPAIRFGALIINEVAAPITNSDAEAIQDAVGRALADGLRGNLSLVRLDIGSNRLGANGAHMLMQAVSVHPSLESLSLAHDRTIGLCGLKLIGMELPHTKLKKIDLDNCAWRYHWMQSSAATSAGQALLNGVWLNTTLTTFSFEGLPPMWNDPIQFFVQLNATCRPLLRSDAVVPAVWPYILEQFQRDAKLSQMYWSLRDQPWLVTTVPRR